MEMPTDEVDRLGVLGDALDGARGAGQQRIARTGLEWISLLLAKNADYGSSVWTVPLLCPEVGVTTAIRVRMSDKIERLRALLDKQVEVHGETLEDTVCDLGAYCLLYLTRPSTPTATEPKESQ